MYVISILFALLLYLRFSPLSSSFRSHFPFSSLAACSSTSILKFYTFPCFAFWLGNTRPRFRHRTPKRDAIVSGCITPSACSRCHAHQRTRANTNFLTSFLCTKETLSLCCSTARPRLRSLSLSTLVDFHPLGKVSDPKSDSD